MNKYKNKREVSEAYVEAAIALDFPLVKYLLTSDELSHKADINFDEAVFNNLCSKDKTGELTKYLFTSPDLTEHLKFSYPGFRSAMTHNNVAVTQFLLEKFDKKYSLDNYLTGEWGIYEMDGFSKEMINLLYFEYAKPGTKKSLLENIVLHNDFDGMKQLLQGDSEINNKEVFKIVSKFGNYAMFELFDEQTKYSSDKKNIPSIVNMSCNKSMDIKLLESILRNEELTGYYDMNSRVFKKVMNRPDLLTILILERNAQATPAIEKICSEEARKIFAARDLNERLNFDLTEKSKKVSRKI
jgi:hypothetical protein